jgi:hypothetical protein
MQNWRLWEMVAEAVCGVAFRETGLVSHGFQNHSVRDSRFEYKHALNSAILVQ